jgi:hypothetical protein
VLFVFCSSGRVRARREKRHHKKKARTRPEAFQVLRVPHTFLLRVGSCFVAQGALAQAGCRQGRHALAGSHSACSAFTCAKTLSANPSSR